MVDQGLHAGAVQEVKAVVPKVHYCVVEYPRLLQLDSQLSRLQEAHNCIVGQLFDPITEQVEYMYVCVCLYAQQVSHDSHTMSHESHMMYIEVSIFF